MSSTTLRIGTYANAGGRGLHRLLYNPTTGFTVDDHVEPVANASFGVWSAKHRMHYLIDEQTMGAVGAYRSSPDAWVKLANVPSDGREPCYLALDEAETRLAVANYGSGSVALVDLAADGTPYAATTLWANSGYGPNRERQEAPHIHCVRFGASGRDLYAVDLGTDQIVHFDLSAGNLETSRVAYRAPPGSGPRHVLFHPDRSQALLVSELASTLTLLKIEDDRLTPIASCSTLPANFTGDSLGGHLLLNDAGDRAYVTNRGHDSIAVIHIDVDARTLNPAQHIMSGGASPRHILLLDQQCTLIAVHEKDGMTTAFGVQSDGHLTETGHAIRIDGAAFAFVDQS